MQSRIITLLAVIFAVIITGYILAYFYRSMPPVINSGVTGVAFLGHSCSVALTPIDKRCPGKPYRGEIPIFSDGRLIKTINTTEGGSFLVYLSPGRYTAQKEGISPSAKLYPVTFTVFEGQFTELKLQMEFVKW